MLMDLIFPTEMVIYSINWYNLKKPVVLWNRFYFFKSKIFQYIPYGP